MNHYEELGLNPSASADQIHKAHRILSRLLHPDQQTDGILRDAAEIQMRRINAMVDVLLDPDKRRAYDATLRSASESLGPLRTPEVRSHWSGSFSLLDLIGIIAAAVMFTLVAMWVVAGDFVHWRGAPEPVSASVVPLEAPAPAVDDSAPFRPRVKPNVRLSASRPDTAVREIQAPAAAAVRRPPADVPLPATAGARVPVEDPLPAPILPAAAAPVPPSNPGFAGLWLLPAGGNTAASRNTPQYIQVKIYGQDERLYGEYTAQYEAPGRPVSPKVIFQFNGPARGDSALCDWNSSDGSHGAIQLRLLTPQSMQVSWHVAEFGSAMAIAGGAAVVIRKAD